MAWNLSRRSFLGNLAVTFASLYLPIPLKKEEELYAPIYQIVPEHVPLLHTPCKTGYFTEDMKYFKWLEQPLYPRIMDNEIRCGIFGPEGKAESEPEAIRDAIIQNLLDSTRD